MYQCFDSDLRAEDLDRHPFKFHHHLLGHPALALENLAEVLPALPKNQVMYSKGLLEVSADFEETFRKRPRDQSLAQTIETIRQRDGFIMVRSPEQHPSFQELHANLMADVRQLMRTQGRGAEPIDGMLYLFVASPNSVTPFHIDRYSTFLMQFRGSKTVTVAEPWDDRAVAPQAREAYVARKNTHLPWSEAQDQLSTPFSFAPGEALHIPFIAGHHVRNGADDVSISMSIIFNTEESLRWRRALACNELMRPRLARVGMAPVAVGASAWRDALKARAWQAYGKLRSW